MAETETATEGTFALEGIETLDLIGTEEKPKEETKEVAEEKASPSAEESSDTPPDETSSFLDAMHKAMGEEEEPKKEEKEPETEPEVEADSKESRSAKDFKKVKEDRDNARRELDELKSKLTDLEDSNVDGVLKELKEERDDLSQRLKLAAIERHPKFQKEFENKVASIIGRAKKLVGAENADRVADLLVMVDSEYRGNSLEEIMLELTTTKQAQLGALLSSIEEVKSNREEALANADETYNKMMADQDAQRENLMADSNKLFDDVAKEANNLEVFQTREGDNDWNSDVSGRLNVARSIFSGENEPRELAKASLWAAAAPKYRELLVAQMELNRRLRQQVKEQGGATPSMSATGEGKTPEKADFMDTMSELMGA
jgi:hypothetical protein